MVHPADTHSLLKTRILAPDKAYWQALGEFIEQFAAIESGMFFLLALYAGVDHLRAAALFSGTRVDAAIKLIRRIIATQAGQYKPHEVLRHQELELLFAQIIVINSARNDVIHYTSINTENFGRVVSNWTRAHIPGNVSVRPMSKDILVAMTADLRTIAMHFFAHTVESDADRDETRVKTRIDALSQPSSWQYKPPQDHEMKLNKLVDRDRPR